MTIKQMIYFSKIVACKSMTKAARELFISQPSLSKAIKDLEEELNITIFWRSPQGLSLSIQGQELLSYVQVILEQTNRLENHFANQTAPRANWSISTQHYAFVIEAFIKTVNSSLLDNYQFHLLEQETLAIIEDVKSGRSEIGVIYLSEFNRDYLGKILKENNLAFHKLLETELYVFVAKNHPLAAKDRIFLDELANYPFLAFEQGEHNSFYLVEEIINAANPAKTIYVSDRATLFNLVVGLKGYTICSGILNPDFNNNNIVAIKLEVDEKMVIGWISRANGILSDFSKDYLAKLKTILNLKTT